MARRIKDYTNGATQPKRRATGGGRAARVIKEAKRATTQFTITKRQLQPLIMSGSAVGGRATTVIKDTGSVQKIHTNGDIRESSGPTASHGRDGRSKALKRRRFLNGWAGS